MTGYRITVRGTPAPQGSKRHVGGGRMVEMSKAVGPWREAVRGETQRAVDEPLTGAVKVHIMFFLARPKGHFRTGRNADQLRPDSPVYPAGRPDVDKLARAVLDGLTMGGAWKDDSQVFSLRAVKAYTVVGWVGCIIDIKEEDQ